MIEQALNTVISLHKNNVKILENRKLNSSENVYECEKVRTMLVYQTNDCELLPIKERKKP